MPHGIRELGGDVLIGAGAASMALVAGADAWQGVCVMVLGIGAAVFGRRRRRAARLRDRRAAVTAGVPDVIDLLAATVDGGIATDVSLVRIADCVDEPLRSLVLDAVAHASDVGIGTRLCAQDPALRPLGSLLRQSEELGVPIAGALRLLAADARSRARSAARERAAAAAPKMLLVVGSLLAPASLMIVIGGQVLVLRDVAGGVLA